MSGADAATPTSLADPARQVWEHPVAGPAVKILLGVLALPVFFSLIGDNPPLGIYLSGLIVGCLHSLVAIGLILVYRSNRVINFAQASLGATPAILALLLMHRRSYPYVQGVVIALLGALILGAIVEFAFVRRFNNAPRLILTLATIGVAQLLGFFELGLSLWIKGDRASNSSRLLLETPFSDIRVELGGVLFTGDHFVTVFIILAVAAGLAAFFRFTNIGMAVRASAENADRALLLGVPVRKVRTIVWVIAALLSAIGVFQRTIVTGSFPAGLAGATTLLYGLAPAVIAKMRSIPVAIVAGLGIGIIDLGAFYATRNATLSNALILPIVVIALLLQRKQLSRSEDTGVETWRQVKEFRPIPPELINVREVRVGRWVMRVLTVAVLLGLPYLTGTGRTDLASVLIVYAIAGVSLVILTGWAGQISLGQFAFVGVGAAVAGGLVANHGIDFVTALVLAGLVGSVIAVLIGIPAVRLPGLFLAVTTLAFAANTQYFILQRQYFGWLLPESTNYVDRPVLWNRVDLTSDHAFYYACVVVFVLAVFSARSLRSHRSGRLMIAVRDNTRSAQSYGINATRVRLAAFALSGFFAAVAGGLLAHIQGVVDPNVFTPAQSLEIFAMVVIGGLTSVGGALLGALYVLGFQYFLPDYSLLASGAGMLLLLLFFPGGLSEVSYSLRDAFLRRVATSKGIYVPSLLADTLNDAPPPADEPIIDETTEPAEETVLVEAVVASAATATGEPPVPPEVEPTPDGIGGANGRPSSNGSNGSNGAPRHRTRPLTANTKGRG